MRILFAAPGYKPAWRVGGPILSISALAEQLVRGGHEVIVFAPNANLDEDLDVPVDRPMSIDGVEVWYFQRQEFFRHYLSSVSYLSRSSGFLYCPSMAAALDRTTPTVDIVHTHLPFNYPTYAAARSAIRYGKPLFYHQRGVFDPERLKFRSLKKRIYLQFFEKPILRRTTALIALTTAEVDSYRRLGLKSPCVVIPNGIDVAAYQGKQGDLTCLGIDPDQIVILFLARLHPIKGVDLLLEAFARIQRNHPRAVLVLAGPDEFGMKERLSAAARRSCPGRVIFPGMVQGELKNRLLARADLFCLPSIAEGFSMAVLEALSSGTPVLLSSGCHFEDVERGGAGRIVPRRADAWADAMDAMLADSALRQTMGERGRRLVSERYAWENISNQLVDVYSRALSARHQAN